MPTSVVSNWATLIEGFQISPQEYYDHVKAAMEIREIPDITLSTAVHKEGGAFSANRLYLRAQRGRYVFDICGAPFGTGFFTSWWLVEKRSRWGLLYLFLILLGIGVGWEIITLLLVAMFDEGSAVLLSVFLLPAYLLIGVPLAFWFLSSGFFKNQEAIDDFILPIPFLGPLYNWVFKPDSYYKQDTAAMFQTAVHAAVLEAVDVVTKDKGVRTLSEAERRLITKSFAAKA